jgi:endonuclease/exonuclease/phosphatase (EEP) superfamily protein YafD
MERFRSGLRALARFADIGAWIVLIPVGAVAAIGLYAHLEWPLDLFAHFAVQCIAAQLLAALYLALRRASLPVFLGLPILLINVVPIARYHLAAPTTATAEYSVRVMILNVDSSNERVDLVRQSIAAEGPDVIFLSEATAQLASAIAPLNTAYPYQVGLMTDSKFSVLLLSRLPLQDPKVHRAGDVPSVSASLCLDSGRPGTRCLTVVGIRPPAPTTRARAEARRAVFRMAAELRAGAMDRPFALLGDFNVTPWSPAFRHLVRATGLRDSAVGFGLHPTFGSRSIILGQLIDHVLVDASITVADHRVGDDVGSDHYPVVVDFSL